MSRSSPRNQRCPRAANFSHSVDGFAPLTLRSASIKPSTSSKGIRPSFRCGGRSLAKRSWASCRAWIWASKLDPRVSIANSPRSLARPSGRWAAGRRRSCNSRKTPPGGSLRALACRFKGPFQAPRLLNSTEPLPWGSTSALRSNPGYRRKPVSCSWRPLIQARAGLVTVARPCSSSGSKPRRPLPSNTPLSGKGRLPRSPKCNGARAH